MAKLTKRGKVYYARLGSGPGSFLSLGTGDRLAAEIALRKLERERADPAYAAANKATVESCLKAHRQGRKDAGRAAGTLHMIGVKSGHLVRLLGAQTPLVLVDARAVDGYVSTRLDEGAARTTIQKELSVLRGTLRGAKRRGEYPHDLLAVMPQGFAAEYVPRVRVLTEEHATKLLAELAPHHAAHAAWLLATGGRWGESLRAERGDAKGSHVLVRGSKTGRAWRTVVVPPYALPLLERAVEGNGAPPLLFARWTNARRDLAAACLRASVPTVSPNDLRRTHATWLRARGVDVGLLAAQLGHADSRMVERVYGRLSPHERERLVDERLAENRAPKAAVRNLSAEGAENVDLMGLLDEAEALIDRDLQCPETELNRRHGDFQSLRFARFSAPK